MKLLLLIFLTSLTFYSSFLQAQNSGPKFLKGFQPQPEKTNRKIEIQLAESPVGKFQLSQPTPLAFLETWVGSNDIILKALRTEFVKENQGTSSFFGPLRVNYLTPEERAFYALHLLNGRIYDAKGEAFDTAGKPAIFIMDANKRFFASKHRLVGFFEHSTLSAGDAVAGAGQIVVKNGVLISLNNKAPQYLPTLEMHHQVVETFAESFITLDPSAVEFFNPERSLNDLKSELSDFHRLSTIQKLHLTEKILSDVYVQMFPEQKAPTIRNSGFNLNSPKASKSAIPAVLGPNCEKYFRAKNTSF